MPFVIDDDNRIVADRETIPLNGAGLSQRNPILKGLGLSFALKIGKSVDSSRLFVDEDINAEALSLDLEKEGNKFSFQEEVGGEGSITGPLVLNPGSTFDAGVGLYFRSTLQNEGFREDIFERKIYIEEIKRDAAVFGPGKVSYEPPFPVLVGSLFVQVEFFPVWKNEEGQKRFGGATTVEVFDTPGAPGTGYVFPIPETAIESVSGISLIDRSGAATIPFYLPPPRLIDFSNFFHFVTFLFRSKAGSPIAKRYDVVFFGSGPCSSVEPEGGYGINIEEVYENSHPIPDELGKLKDKSRKSGDDLEKVFDREGKEIENPKQGKSGVEVETTENFLNLQSDKIIVRVYENEEDADPVATYTNTFVTSATTVLFCPDDEDQGRDVTQGFVEIFETSPERVSERIFMDFTSQPGKPVTFDLFFSGIFIDSAEGKIESEMFDNLSTDLAAVYTAEYFDVPTVGSGTVVHTGPITKVTTTLLRHFQADLTPVPSGVPITRYLEITEETATAIRKTFSREMVDLPV